MEAGIRHGESIYEDGGSQKKPNDIASEVRKQLDEVYAQFEAQPFKTEINAPVDRAVRPAITLSVNLKANKNTLKAPFTVTLSQHPSGNYVIKVSNHHGQRKPIWHREHSRLQSLPATEIESEINMSSVYEEISIVIKKNGVYIEGLKFDGEGEAIDMKYPAMSTFIYQIVSVLRSKINLAPLQKG